MTINELNQKFAISDKLVFCESKGDLPIASIKNQFAVAEISLYGAHILKYQPVGQNDLLWMSACSMFEKGKPIRGGIPVCFPWFGPHINDSSKPQHGFARLLTWNVIKTSEFSNETVELILELTSNDYTRELWPCEFRAEMKFIIGSSLEVELTYHNTDNQSFVCSDALHTYFNISDVANTKISGLQGITYYNGFEKEASGKQTEQYLNIQQEENRRYIRHSGECIIEDSGLNRKIHVCKKGSNVTVVWNPWENARNIVDMPDNGYKTMVCVEAVNAYDDIVTVDAGKSYSVSTKIWVE